MGSDPAAFIRFFREAGFTLSVLEAAQSHINAALSAEEMVALVNRDGIGGRPGELYVNMLAVRRTER